MWTWGAAGGEEVEATGSEKVANDAINYVRRAGTLMIYGVYNNSALLHWPPSKIFGDEIRVSPHAASIAIANVQLNVCRVQIIGSFSQAYCFPRAVAYLDGGKVNVKGMVRLGGSWYSTSVGSLTVL